MEILYFLALVSVVVSSPTTTDRDIFGMHVYDENDRNATQGSNKPMYDTTFDDMNVDAILSNERVFRKYLRCLLEASDGDCTHEGKLIKGTLPEVLSTFCAKCSMKQRAGVDKVVRYLLLRRHDAWERLEVRYDPEGVYWAKYEALYSRPDFHL